MGVIALVRYRLGTKSGLVAVDIDGIELLIAPDDALQLAAQLESVAEDV